MNRIHFLTILSCCILIACREPGVKSSTASGHVLPDTTFALNQRGSTSFGPAGKQITISIDDITGGKTNLEVSSEAAMHPLLTKTMHTGESVTFQYLDETYRLTVNELVNRLMDGDHAIIAIAYFDGTTADIQSNPQADPRANLNAEIEAVLDSIAKSGLTFVRNGDNHDSKDAADHLRSKWKNAGLPINTWEDFVQYVASTSSMSGKPYEIINEKGQTVLLRDWIETVRRK